MTTTPTREPTPAEEAKLVAETEKTQAERDEALSRTRLAEATTVLGNRKLEAEAREAEAAACMTEINARALARMELIELAADRHHHVYNFTTSVTPSSVKNCMDQLTVWSRNDDGCAIEVVFNSPGGSVIDGMALFDFLQILRRKGHTITTATLGYAASMAGILLQAGDVRVMGKESWLMIHEAAFGAAGKIGEVEDTVDWVKRVCERILDIFAERCQATDAPKKLTRSQIKKLWERRDFWISSDEALKFGLIDEVR